MKKILILFGGNSFEHEVSCISCKTILENIDRSKYDVSSVYISKDNDWYIFDDDLDYLSNGNIMKSNLIKIDNIIKYLKSFDKVFPIIHGQPLENGDIQGLFNMFNIDYVGSDLLSSIISYDKDITKIICDKYDIPQVSYIVIKENKKIKEIPIEYPVIIKPSKCGSSIGINIANNIEEVNKYIKEAFKYDNKVIIERFITARELECAILDEKKIKVSDVGEIKSVNTFYDYEAKYKKESKLIIPADISINLKNKIQELSIKIFKILELSTLSRIDFLYDEKHDKLYFNEVNTMPGFTSGSMYPLLFNHSNIDIKKLITKLIEN